jgi:hypothetical protein
MRKNTHGDIFNERILTTQQLMRTIIETHHENERQEHGIHQRNMEDEFVELTGLLPTHLKNILGSKPRNIHCGVIISIAKGYCTNLQMSVSLFSSAGYDLISPMPLFTAYADILSPRNRTWSISRCNKYLRSVGITDKRLLLGSHEYKKKSKE